MTIGLRNLKKTLMREKNREFTFAKSRSPRDSPTTVAGSFLPRGGNEEMKNFKDSLAADKLRTLLPLIFSEI